MVWVKMQKNTEKICSVISLEIFLKLIIFPDGEPMMVTSWQTLAISKIATAAEKSARTGQTVELNWSKDGIPAIYS